VGFEGLAEAGAGAGVPQLEPARVVGGDEALAAGADHQADQRGRGGNEADQILLAAQGLQQPAFGFGVGLARIARQAQGREELLHGALVRLGPQAGEHGRRLGAQAQPDGVAQLGAGMFLGGPGALGFGFGPAGVLVGEVGAPAGGGGQPEQAEGDAGHRHAPPLGGAQLAGREAQAVHHRGGGDATGDGLLGVVEPDLVVHVEPRAHRLGESRVLHRAADVDRDDRPARVVLAEGFDFGAHPARGFQRAPVGDHDQDARTQQRTQQGVVEILARGGFVFAVKPRSPAPAAAGRGRRRRTGCRARRNRGRRR
jgi:hypothetical protein